MADQTSKIIVDEELVQHYARIKNVPYEEARRKVEENLTKEASVDIRQQMTTLMNSFRKMAPQLHGVVLRETDTATSISQLKNENAALHKQVLGFEKRLDFERDNYKRALELLNGIIREDAKTQKRIADLEASSVPLYKRMWNRIKCLLNS